jgi:hypothetical protein
MSGRLLTVGHVASPVALAAVIGLVIELPVLILLVDVPFWFGRQLFPDMVSARDQAWAWQLQRRSRRLSLSS